MITETKTRDFLEYPDGGVYMAIIELQEQEEGTLFTSPVDGATHLVKGATIETIRGKWWEGDFSSEILDAVSEMGGCRWVLGERTEYDYHEHKGKHYLEVTEIGRQEEEK
jgi:hypothetical protein